MNRRRALLFLIGLVLLAPGAYSLVALSSGVSMLSGIVTGDTSTGGWPIFLGLAGLWVAGLLVAALGLWLIAKALPSAHGP